MIKYIAYIILLVLIGYASKAQFPSQQTPTQFSTGWFKQGWHQSDSGHILANRLPNFTPRFPGTMILYQQAGVDSSVHYYNGGRWLKLSQFDSTSLSNRINLKLNTTDTTLKWWGVGKRWVDTLYRVNDSTVGFTINEGAQQTFQILGRLPSGGGGSGTVTSVGLSLPSAFNVTPSTITTSGTFAVTGAGTTLQYIRGNGTLATTDTGMIPNFHLKVRSLFSGTSPITFNQTTGLIGISNANTSGTKGAASFNSASFSDNGSGLISLNTPISAGSCTNCNLTMGADGRVTLYGNGTGPSGAAVDTIWRTEGIDSIYFTVNGTQYAIKDSSGSSVALNNIGAGYRWLATPAGNFKSVFPSNTIIWDSTSTANTLTAKADTSVLATQFDLSLVNNGLSRRGDTTQLGALNNSASPLNHDSYINTAGFKLIVQGSTATSGNTFEANNLGAGTGMYGTSINEYGVAGSSTNLYGVYGLSTTSNAVRGWTTNGNTAAYFEGTASSTNTVIPTVQIKRTTSGSAAAGIGSSIEFFVEKDNGANNTVSNSLRSLLTTATSGAEVSQFEIYGVNEATLGRKAALTGTGQWTWDGYTAGSLEAADSTNYKPIVTDASGNIRRMVGWPGGGGGGSPSLTATQVAFGSVGNTMTSESGFTYDATNNKLNVDSVVFRKALADSIMMGSYESDYVDSSTFFGTSITAGTDATPITTNRYSAITAAGLRTFEVNKGQGGYLLQHSPTWPLTNTFKDHYTELIQPKTARSRYMFMAWGENDATNEYLYGAMFNVDTSFFKRDYGIVINYAVSLGWSLSDIRIISPFYQLIGRCPLAIQQKYVDASKHFADSMGIQWINVFDQGKNYNSLILSDDIHPSNYGHSLAAYAILDAMNQPLQAASGENFINANISLLNSVKFFGKDTATSGYSLAAFNSNGTMTKVPSERYLLLDNTNVPVQSGNASVRGNVSAGVALRASGQTTFSTGSGFELYYVSGDGYLFPYNRDASTAGNVIIPFGKFTVGAIGAAPFSKAYIDGPGFAKGLYSSSSGDILYNTNLNHTTLNMLVSGDSVGHITTYGVSGYKPTAINGNDVNPVLINKLSNNGIGALQINGKLTVATHTIAANSDSAVVRVLSTGEYQYAKINTGSTTTIYNGDGTLPTDRNFGSGGFTLRLSGTNNSDTVMSIINTGTSGTGLFASGTLFGIDAQSTNVGLRAFGTVQGIVATGDNSYGATIKSNSIAGLLVQSVPATTNTVQEVVRFERGVNGSPGANGVGGSADFFNKASDNSSNVSNQLISKWTDATVGTRTSQFSITGVNSASTNTILTIDGDGSITTTGKRIIALTTSSAGTLTLGNKESYIFNGTTTTWTLPPVSGTTGTIYYIKNIGSGSITLNADGGNNEIYSSSAVNTITVTAGSAVILISNNTYWTVN